MKNPRAFEKETIVVMVIPAGRWHYIKR